MVQHINILLSMALLRLIAGSLEIAAALLMVKLGRIDTAMRINGLLGLVGPIILILVSALGVLGLANQVPLERVLLIALGVFFIFLGTR